MQTLIILFKYEWLLPSHVKDNLAEEGQIKRCIRYIATDLYRNAHNPLSGTNKTSSEKLGRCASRRVPSV